MLPAMKAAYFYALGDIRTEDVPSPTIVDAHDAVVRVLKSCICGSDLWYYRGVSDFPQRRPIGHEFVGVVEETGSGVASLRAGDVVIAPWAISCGTCEFCAAGLYTSCLVGGYWGKDNDGGQAEAVRVPHADGTLVKTSPDIIGDDHLQKCMLTLSDVMGTGHHSAVMAEVRPGSTTVVVGDGAVGLCATLAAKRLGSERIIAVGRHDDRLEIAKQFGASDVIRQSDDSVGEIIEMTNGGAMSVCECVGLDSSIDLAIGVARPGGSVGIVGAPHLDRSLSIDRPFEHNIALRLGVAPVRKYIEELSADILSGAIDPSAVFDYTISIDQIADGYRAMDERRSIKTLIDF